MSYINSGKHGEYKQRKLVNGNIVELLSRSNELEAVHINMEPGKKLGKAHKHKGQEFKYVLEGTLEFKIGDIKKIVGAGGWIHHDCATPHAVENKTSKPASYITISVPPGCLAMK